MTLLIDTRQANSVKFLLSAEKKAQRRPIYKMFKLPPGGNHQTVALLDKFLRNKKIKTGSIKTITAYSGPGSFNGIRIGLSIAQALGLAWNVPIKIIPAGETARS